MVITASASIAPANTCGGSPCVRLVPGMRGRRRRREGRLWHPLMQRDVHMCGALSSAALGVNRRPAQRVQRSVGGGGKAARARAQHPPPLGPLELLRCC